MNSAGQLADVEFDYAGTKVSFMLPSADDHISKVLLSNGTFYEQQMLESLAPLLEPGDLVMDAGANIGNHTLYFSKILQCRVIAFEPIDSTADILAENVERNHVDELVQVRRVALGEASGRANIESFDPANIGGTTLVLSDQGTVGVEALDDIVTGEVVRLVKVDVEGMDLAVLKGARRLLDRDRPLVVCEAADRERFRPILDFMGDCGYVPVAVYNATDSYLFLPARNEAECRALVNRIAGQVIDLQRETRRLDARLAQAGRYSERMRNEAIDAMERRANDLRKVLADQTGSTGSTGDAMTDDIERPRNKSDVERDVLRQQVEFHESREAQRLVRIAAMEQQLSAERERVSALAADTQTRDADAMQEVADLVAKLAAMKAALIEKTEALRGAKQALEVAREHQRRLEEGWRAKAQALLAERTKLVGGVARKEREIAKKDREIADKSRRIASAHRVLRERTNRLAFVESERKDMQESASYRLGHLITSSLRSPGKAIAMVWTVPAFLGRELRRRHTVAKSAARIEDKEG